jgi:hypothetical protein
VDNAQLTQLRAWAEALAGDADPERKASGRALLLLIGEVETLRARLNAVIEAERMDDDEMAEPDGGYDEHDEPEPAIEDTAPIRLRDRIKAAAHLNHDA